MDSSNATSSGAIALGTSDLCAFHAR